MVMLGIASHATFGPEADFRDNTEDEMIGMAHLTQTESYQGMNAFLDLDSESSSSSNQASPFEHPTPLQPPPRKKLNSRDVSVNNAPIQPDFFTSKIPVTCKDEEDPSALALASPSHEVPPSVGDAVRAMLDLSPDDSTESHSPPELVMSASPSDSERSRRSSHTLSESKEINAVDPEFDNGLITVSSHREHTQKVSSTTRSTEHQELESLSLSVSQCSRACIIRPRRGPFETQLVALIACSLQQGLGQQSQPACKARPDESSQISLPGTDEEAQACSRYITKLRTAVKEWGGEHAQPDVWIPFHSMPTSADSSQDIVMMQDWIEAVDSKTEDLIMAMQLNEPGPRPLESLLAAKRKPLPSPDRLSMLLADNTMGKKDGIFHPTLEYTNGLKSFPLSAIQRLFFRASANQTKLGYLSGPSQRFNQSILLEISSDVDSTDIEDSLEALVTRHSMLRARFRVNGEDVAQVVLPDASNSYRFGHRQAVNDKDVLKFIEQSQASIDINAGPVFAADHMFTAGGRELLYLVAHHLVVDVSSWEIIVHDLEALLSHGHLRSDSATFPDWVDYQLYDINNHLVGPSLPFRVAPTDVAYWGLEKKHNTYGRTGRHTLSLSHNLTESIGTRCNRVFRTETADILLAALLLSFHHVFSDRPPPTIWKQECGRNYLNSDLNISGTVGWFTSLCPIVAEVDSSTDFIQLLKLVKDTRRAIPRHGVAFFNSEFLSAQKELSDLPVEVMFNCVESIPQLHRPGGLLKPTSPPHHQEAKPLISDVGSDVGRMALFEISAVMDGEGTHIEAVYIRTPHQVRIQEWFRVFEELLIDSEARLQTMDPQLTLADTPLIKTSYSSLSSLNSELLEDVGIESIENIETILPINVMQEDILIAQVHDISSYQVRCVYELRSPCGEAIDQARICDAWTTLVSKHVALRSIFINSISDHGLFDQLVLKKVSPSMLFFKDSCPEDTLKSLPPLQAALGQPCHRLSVICTPTQTFICLDASQALVDSRSMVNLVSQLGQLYAGEDVNVDSELLTNYLHSISIDANSLLGAATQQHNDTKPCILPNLGDGSHQPASTSTFELGVLHRDLINFCRGQDVQPNIVLKLAWALTLRIYVGTNDLVFKYEHSGRDEDVFTGIAESIGSFSTILPCKISLNPKRTIQQCLITLGRFSASTTSRETSTASRAEHALNSEHRLLYNTCLSFLWPRKVPEGASGGFASSLWSSSNTMDSALSLHFAFLSDKIHMSASSRGISADQVRNTIHTFEQALKTIMECPMQLVSDIDLFTDRDYAHLAMKSWERRDEYLRPQQCLHQVILQHARSRPSAMAVVAEGGGITYQQMSKFVSSLAVHLINLGVRPGVVVPVVLEKSWWAPIIILGVLQAGGAFACLDNLDPESFEKTLIQLDPHIIITGESAWTAVTSVTANVVVVNNSFFSALPPQLTIPAQSPTPEHAACVLYSPAGKRAVPRSIYYTHSSLSLAFLAQGKALKLDHTSRVLQLSAFSNDIALAEVLGTLLHGGCICIPAPHERGYNLEKGIARMNVTWTYMTSVLIRKISPKNVPSLKTICFRTRRLDDDIKEAWLGTVNMLLAYGATDVCPLAISVSEVVEEHNAAIIPAPLMGKYWILNPENPKKLMPVGAIGELAIDSPEITPHKFTPGGPLVAPSVSSLDSSDQPGPRSLRTGHRVRYLDDGSIEFLSSIRDDIDISGETIPTPEVESRLRKYLGKNVDVALETVTTSDQKRVLVAFLEVPDDKQRSELERSSIPGENGASVLEQLVQNTAPSSSKPRASSQKVIASQMPSVYIPVKTFPLSSSLKINRRKLQKMVSGISHAQLQDMSAFLNPNQLRNGPMINRPLTLTQVEERMRNTWASVLQVPAANITPQDSLPGLKGNRYQAAQLVKACRETGYPVSIEDIIRGKPLASICQPFCSTAPSQPRVRSKSFEGHRATSNPTPGHAHSKVAGLPEIFVKEVLAPQLKEYRHNIADAAEASPHQARELEGGLYKVKSSLRWLVLSFNGPVRHQRLEAACMALSKLHPILRTSFAVHERRVYQVLVDSFRPEFTHRTCALTDIDKEAKRIANHDQTAGFKLREPVTRFFFLDGVHQGALLVRLSNTQIDEHSIPHVIGDLTTLYKNPGASFRRSSFFDLVRALRFSNHQEGLEFWKKQLDGARMTQAVSHTKPPAPSSGARKLCQTLKVEDLTDLGLSFDTVLKTAWGIMLATLSGNNDVLFGEVIHQQNMTRHKDVNISSMLGPVSNVIPVRIRFPAMHTSPMEIMQAVQEQRASSRPYESIGGLELIEKCTDWPCWTRFSTVVEHRPQALGDGTTTLKMGSTSFRYYTIEPEALDVPDLFAQTSMDGPESVQLEITYSEARIPQSLADNILMLLTTNIEMLTKRDPIDKPLLKPADQIALSAPRIPVPQRRPVARQSFDSTQWVDDERRVQLQALIQTAWTEHINPLASGVAASQVHKTKFYEIWGSLLPATFLADHLNQELPKLDINSSEGRPIRFTAEEMIDNPTMQMQYDLIVQKMKDSDAITEPIVKKSHTGSTSASPGHRDLWATASPSTVDGSPSWRRSIRRFRTLETRPSVRSLSTKASGWMRHKVSASHDGTAAGSVGRSLISEEDSCPPATSERRSLDSTAHSTSRLSLLSSRREQGAGSPSSAPQITNQETPVFKSHSLRTLTSHIVPSRSDSISSNRTPSKASLPASIMASSSMPRLSPRQASLNISAKPLPTIPPSTLSDPLNLQSRPFPLSPPPGGSTSGNYNSSTFTTPLTANHHRTLDPIAEPVELASREITRSRLDKLQADPTDGLVFGPDGMIIAELDTSAATVGVSVHQEKATASQRDEFEVEEGEIKIGLERDDTFPERD